MPIEIHKNVAETEISATELDSRLFENGSPTLAGQVIGLFLESVEFDALLDDEDVAEHIDVAEATLKGADDADEVEIVEAGAEGGELSVIESLDGDIAADFVDMDDMTSMFEHFAVNLPEGTVEERVLKATALELLGEGFDLKALDEASIFKKGDFRKIHKGTVKTPGGKTGPALINRMLGAMMKKEAITRAKAPGKGYKSGDYQKNPSGYGGGTAKGRKAVMMFKDKNKSKLAVKAKRVKGGAGAEAKLKAKAVSTAAKAKAKAAALTKKKGKMSKVTSKKSLVAHDTEAVSTLNESVNLSHQALPRAVSMINALNRTFGTPKK